MRCLKGLIGLSEDKALSTEFHVSSPQLRNVSTFSAVRGRTGFRNSVSRRKASSVTEQTACSSAALSGCLANSQGCFWSTYSLTLLASSITARRALPYSRPSKEALISGAAALISAIRLLSAMAGSETRPSKRLTRKPAERLAMLTYLPTKSELVREMKSAELKSTSSTLELSL